MVSRGINFFAFPDEFLEFLNKAIHRFGLYAVLAIRKKDALIENLPLPLNYKNFNSTGLYDIFLTDIKVGDGIPVSAINRPKEGWIQVVLPKLQDNMLIESNIAIRTDWYDENEKRSFDSKKNISLFNKITSMLKKQLHYPVIGYDIRTGAFHKYKIGYTDKVEKFIESGGELVQADIYGFVRFAINESGIKVNPNYQLPKL